MVEKQYEKEKYTLLTRPLPIIFTGLSASIDFKPDDVPGWHVLLEDKTLVRDRISKIFH